MRTLVQVTKVRPTAFLKALVLLIIGGCTTGNDVTTPSAGAGTGPDLEIAVSSAGVESGKQVVVAVRPSTTVSVSLAGVQGRLRFDPARLRFVGQIPSGATFVVANWTAASSGVLRLLALSMRLERVAPALFVFDVLAPDYVPTLQFETEAMVAVGGNPITPSRVPPRTTGDSSPANSATPRLLTVGDWAELLGGNRMRTDVAALETSQAAIYGDANLNGVINVLDALATANAAVGNVPLLTNPARDFAIAANVVPANLSGLGEDGDPVPPGRESDGTFVINILDAAAITNESIGNDPPVVGEPIPGRTPPTEW